MSSPRRYKGDVSGAPSDIANRLGRVAGNIQQHDGSRIEAAIVGYGNDRMGITRVGWRGWIRNNHGSKSVATGGPQEEQGEYSRKSKGTQHSRQHPGTENMHDGFGRIFYCKWQEGRALAWTLSGSVSKTYCQSV